MDYLKLSKDLKNEFFAANKRKYPSPNAVVRFLLTIIFIPLRVGYFFARLGYWFTWFFFKCFATPVEYLQTWLKKQQEGLHPAPQTVLYYCCIPTIFLQQIVLHLQSASPVQFPLLNYKLPYQKVRFCFSQEN